jgi:hypothetical protein
LGERFVFANYLGGGPVAPRLSALNWLSAVFSYASADSVIPILENPGTDLLLTNRIHKIRISTSNAPARSELVLCFHQAEISFIAAIDFFFQTFSNHSKPNNQLDATC